MFPTMLAMLLDAQLKSVIFFKYFEVLSVHHLPFKDPKQILQTHGIGTNFPKRQDMGTQKYCTFSTSTTVERSGENLCVSVALSLPQPRNNNTTFCSELVCIWQNKGKATPLIHPHRKEEHCCNLMSPCGLATAPVVLPTSPPPRKGSWLTSLSWNWLKAQTAPRCQHERPLSGRVSTICSMVTVPFFVGGGQRIVGGALGIQEHQSYCTTEQASTEENCSGWYLRTL